LNVIVFLMFFVALGGAGRHALLFDVFYIAGTVFVFAFALSSHPMAGQRGD
jgi:hypothetical protein